MGQAFLYGNGSASGGAGGTLTVSAPAGVTVTVSKDDKTKTKIADSSGVAVFKGLKEGIWTVTITDGEKTATKDVTVTTDYSTAIAFFAATINATYPSGSTCTATDGATTLTAPDTSGTWTCVVPNAGEWTVTATDGDKTKSDTVTISTNGQSESITLQYIVYLFKDGDTCDALTGGWNGTVDAEKQALRLYAAAGKTANAYTKSAIDLTEYDAILAKTGVASGISLKLYIEDKLASDNPIATGTIASGATELSLDISSITGSHLVRLYAYSEKGGTRYVYEVSLQ